VGVFSYFNSNSFLDNNHGKTNEDVEILLGSNTTRSRTKEKNTRDSRRMVDKDVEIVLGSIVACCMKNCMEATINGNVGNMSSDQLAI
jgi:hypothetical protein